ncbi:peptidase [Palleronia sp. LCG004]|uniref:peptidase n=1 Tax=Palleronia sp. LCG004 TaxID=3079304 RepID=UPI00294368D8|nr:peptidase [Palleronia sp. LCG004]WOI55005.1 peptidase [Palleronia sp. LCG004]
MTAFIVDAARTWIGTPYVHQASCRGAGADCLGLVLGVWRDAVGPEPVILPPYTHDWSEPQGDETMWREADRLLRPAIGGTWIPGQILLFRMRDAGIAKHLGIVASTADGPSFIHAYSGHGVIESPLSQPWKRRVVARYEFPTREH